MFYPRLILCLACTASAVAPTIWAAGAQVEAPGYTAASVVNAASYSPDALAPNTIASIYGAHLSYGTHALNASDFIDDGLPGTLDGVSVIINGIEAGLLYVSPGQINLLVPNMLAPGEAVIQVTREGVAGPSVTVHLHETGPALFADTSDNAIATHADYSLITADNPAKPGEVVVLYCEGLGRTDPDASSYQPAHAAAFIKHFADFSVSLDGALVDHSDVLYAGITPEFAGLYQVNLKLPLATASNPELVIAVGQAASAPKIHLFVQ